MTVFLFTVFHEKCVCWKKYVGKKNVEKKYVEKNILKKKTVFVKIQDQSRSQTQTRLDIE